MRCFVLALVLIASTVADDVSCPFNSKGKHPKCICNGDNPYDAVNRICATVLDADYLVAKCPKGSEGTFPACICGEGKVYVPERDECVKVDRSKCPAGSKLVDNKCVCASVNEFKYEFDEIFWICRPWYIPTTHAPITQKPCPSHQHRVGDICEWDRCPAGYLSKSGYWPDCVQPPTCQEKGMIGEYPNCHPRVVHKNCDAHMTGDYPDCHWLPCPAEFMSKTGFWPDCSAPPTCQELGMIGTYPNCKKTPPPCPEYRRRNANGECVRIECPPGHVGDYQPNCKLVPKCPPEYPGVWPNCNIYATTPRNENSRITTTKITTTPRATTTTLGTTTTPRTTTLGTTSTPRSTTIFTTTPKPRTTRPTYRTPRSTAKTTPYTTTTTPTPFTTTTRTPYTTTTTPTPYTTTTRTPYTTTTTPKPTTTAATRATTTTTRASTTTARATTTTTTVRTTARPNKCFCDCASDEIVIFRDNVVRDPSRKYKRFINQKHFNEN